MDLKSRFRLTRRNAIIIAAIVAAVGLGAFVSLDLLFADRMTPARAVSMLDKSSPQLVAVLRKDFGADFSRIVKAAAESEPRLETGTPLVQFLDRQTRPIVEQLADVGRRAPDDLVAAWMRSQANAMAQVQDIAGPELCAKFVNEGLSTLIEANMLEQLVPAFDARDAAFFAALAAARDAEGVEPVGESTDADWDVVSTAMNGLEVPAGYGQIVSSDNAQSRDYCPALAYYFNVISALPGESGSRIRAEYFAQSLS